MIRSACRHGRSARRGKRRPCATSSGAASSSSRATSGRGSARSTSSPATASTLVFVEVKARRDRGGEPPEASVDARKRARLVRLALGYLAARRLGEQSCRFDVVGVSLDGRAG